MFFPEQTRLQSSLDDIERTRHDRTAHATKPAHYVQTWIKFYSKEINEGVLLTLLLQNAATTLQVAIRFLKMKDQRQVEPELDLPYQT